MSAELPPSATLTWSKPLARAVLREWSCRVPDRYGSSCFGSPSRVEHQAASTRPVTNPSAGRAIRNALGTEGVAAALRAEVVELAIALEVDARLAHRHLHAADGAGRSIGRGDLRRLARNPLGRRLPLLL